MGSLLRHSIRAALALPLSCLRLIRAYERLSSIQARRDPRILLLACHWIGDTLWAAQVVPALRNRFPEAYIGCVTKPVCAPLWSGELAVDACHDGTPVTSDRHRESTSWTTLRRLASEAGSGTWDLVVDLTGNRYSAVLAHWLHARHTLGFDGGEAGALYATCVKGAERPGRHLSERPFRVAAPLLGTFPTRGQIVPPQPQESFEAACARYGLPPERPVTVLAPGAGWREKEWGDEPFAHLVRNLAQDGHHIALVDSPAGKGRLEGIARLVGDAQPGPVLVAEAGLDAALALISGCRLFVGNDSGLGHVAAAMGRTTVSVFTGATDPVACAPLGRDVHVVHAGEVEGVWTAIRTLLHGDGQAAGCARREGDAQRP